MKRLERIALAICVINIVAFAGLWDIMLGWGLVVLIPATMIFYRKLREKSEHEF